MFLTRSIKSTGPPTIGLAVAAALLAACGGHTATRVDTTPALDGAPQASASVEPSEGPMSAGHTWPDGLTAKVTDVRKMDPKLGWQVASDRTLVRVTLTLTDTGAASVPLTSGVNWWHVAAGPNRTPVPDDGGDQFTGPQLSTLAWPERVTPGSPVTVFASYDVPTADLNTLAVRVDMGDPNRTPYTFTGSLGG